MDVIDALDHSFQHTQGLLANLRPEQLDNATPCAGWTVRDLLTHSIGVVAGMGAAASGQAAAPFELGADPAAQFAQASASTLAAWRSPGVLDAIVDGGAGPMPGRVLAGINLLDTSTHAWDLAVATGQPTELPEPVAAAALAASTMIVSPEIRPGRFGDEVEVAGAASTTERLVAFLGRQP